MEKPTPPQAAGTTQPVELTAQAPPTYERNTPSIAVDGPADGPPNNGPYIYRQPPQDGIAPQGIRPAGGMGTQTFASAPIELLQSMPAPVHCPSCGTRAVTVATPETGNFVHGAAALMCFFTCLGCIPYLISSLKDVNHRCSNCGIPLAKFHRSGRTEVLFYAAK
ncbi:LITAF-like zinc ribbon domain-containing protein [Dactylonectria estremocensis]|uniref:LITAF-like zinc ribbon domain-containing protein n=1 Tax=Dactylonectria estremocensis TaxID=1079267 RepID=A0A9P9J5L4_9HYPO|nr:LITAF-like zinc ribbon domain-containing protein [Dactylonectria estremocensis]